MPHCRTNVFLLQCQLGDCGAFLDKLRARRELTPDPLGHEACWNFLRGGGSVIPVLLVAINGFPVECVIASFTHWTNASLHT